MRPDFTGTTRGRPSLETNPIRPPFHLLTNFATGPERFGAAGGGGTPPAKGASLVAPSCRYMVKGTLAGTLEPDTARTAFIKAAKEAGIFVREGRP